ncbi:NAP1-related protein 2 [Grifola frondosa]|uniref:NAP1-related protein 2 n=1 Tax=Grifola frondosa TaxID=5627 RepID=A0A1C7MQD8_GRIFR|nr:NAP1-related protein 2 [Grifola frondosa]
MTGKGVKRASPGTDVEKNPLGDVEILDEEAQKLQGLQKDLARVDLVLERHAQQKLLPVYEKRRNILKAISKFWPVALMNHSMFALHAQHNSDQVALSYLEDLWLTRDPVESRCFTLEFHFKENPQGRSRRYTESMLDFSWERDVEPQSMKIDWKDDSKKLTKLHPYVKDEDEQDLPSEGGSFFNFFEVAEDAYDLGVLIANEIFPDAIDFFLGKAGGDDIDSDEDEDSEDDENEDEIDLEKPRPKKQKKA